MDRAKNIYYSPACTLVKNVGRHCVVLNTHSDEKVTTSVILLQYFSDL